MSVCGWWGLGLVPSSCGKIPRTFSPTPTHNTQMEEGRGERKGKQREQRKKRSVDKRNGRQKEDWRESCKKEQK